jgi:steroid delta-isomerase-like uncharacterized protein
MTVKATQTLEERNKEVIRQAIQAFNDRDLDRFFSLHTEDTTSHEVYFPEPLGRDQFRAFLEEFLEAYPDAHIETQNMVAQGNQVAIENVFTATFLKPLKGVQPTGKSFLIREGVFFELKDGKIHRARIYLDQKTAEEQLGLRHGEGTKP